MEYVLLTAVGVGGSTVFGAVIGFLFKKGAEKFGDIVLSFASGIMLAASVFSLIIPSVEYATERSGTLGVAVTVLGIFSGALCLTVIDKLLPHFNKAARDGGEYTSSVILFVFAIGVHNLPEGLAAGVSFGSGNISDTLMIAGSIALQNIPEGMVIISPMLAAGFSPKKTFMIALSTGAVEVVGTLLGYFAVSVSGAVLPFALSFAGGTMLYVIADDMIPKTHADGPSGSATYSLLFGFALMVIFDTVL